MSKLKRKNPKIVIVKLDGKKPEKKLFKIPLNGFVEFDDPNYEMDDFFECY